MEVGIARETMPCRQHETSFEHELFATDGLRLIVPLRRPRFQFLLLWYTFAMPEKVAVLTGASSGFGLLTSVELAKAGFRVIASMRDLGRRERLVQAAASAEVSGRIDVRELDVTPCRRHARVRGQQ